jgi:hypothetical protein
MAACAHGMCQPGVCLRACSCAACSRPVAVHCHVSAVLVLIPWKTSLYWQSAPQSAYCGALLHTTMRACIMSLHHCTVTIQLLSLQPCLLLSGGNQLNQGVWSFGRKFRTLYTAAVLLQIDASITHKPCHRLLSFDGTSFRVLYRARLCKRALMHLAASPCGRWLAVACDDAAVDHGSGALLFLLRIQPEQRGCLADALELAQLLTCVALPGAGAAFGAHGPIPTSNNSSRAFVGN